MGGAAGARPAGPGDRRAPVARSAGGAVEALTPSPGADRPSYASELDRGPGHLPRRQPGELSGCSSTPGSPGARHPGARPCCPSGSGGTPARPRPRRVSASPPTSGWSTTWRASTPASWRLRVDAFGRQLDAVGLLRARLSEHAVHSWDVAVSLEPAATVHPNSIARWSTSCRDGEPGRRTAAAPGRARGETSDPERRFALIADGVRWSPGRASPPRAACSCPPRPSSGSCTAASTRPTPRRSR